VPLDPADYALTPEEPEFAGMVADALEEYSAYDQDLASLALALGEATDTTGLEQLGGEFEEALVAIAEETALGPSEEMAPVFEVVDQVGAGVVDAYNEIPAEAWQPVPDPWTPPPEAGGFYVTPEPGPPGNEVGPLPQLPYQPGAPASGVSLFNLAAPGSTLFHIGNTFRILVWGQANSPVTITVWQNGAQEGPAVVGYTGATGTWETMGVMSQFELGEWLEEWRVAGAVVGMLHFTVE